GLQAIGKGLGLGGQPLTNIGDLREFMSLYLTMTPTLNALTAMIRSIVGTSVQSAINNMRQASDIQAYVRQPELAAAHSNREYAYKHVGDAVNTISDVAQASGQSDVHAYKGPGELAAALNKLDHKIIMDPLSYN
ncbi:catenin alpha-2-like isoform X4, partial [Biomphalaria pfeifferi]